MPACGHIPVIHARSLRGVIKRNRTENASRTRCMALHTHKPCDMCTDGALGSSASMQMLCLLKRRCFIAAVVAPQSKDDPGPNVGKRSHGHRVAFAFSSLAQVIISGPGFTLRTLPGKLVQSIAQGFDTPPAAMRSGVRPALKQDRRGATQRLQTAGILIAAPIIADFCQQSRSQMCAGTRQALKDLMVLMGKKRV